MDIVSLIDGFVSSLFEIEEDFFQDPDKFEVTEQAAKSLGDRTMAQFLSMLLTEADEMIQRNSLREGKFDIQRHKQRSLVSTVGDISFTQTKFRDKETGEYRTLLNDMLGLPPKERFTTLAEAKTLDVAEAHSYQYAADALRFENQTITKVTVMNKVHKVEEDVSEFEDSLECEKKVAEYLYIEADEDHIHRQKAGEKDGCMIGKLAYLFEGKEDVCKGKRELVQPFYFGGLFPGEENAKYWENIERFIQKHYDQELLKTVYICSDGATWIKAGQDHIYKSVLVSDRFHLMKYINKISRLTGDRENETKGRFYKYIYKDKLIAAEKMLTRIENRYGGEKAVEECRTYFINNWEAIQRAFHDKNALGCSAEGHVSNVYSDRMSSRPMGWSETGSDRMCKLRCFVRNHGREKIVDLVKYRREKELAELKATGTEDVVVELPKEKFSLEQKRAYAYVEKLQATIGGNTVRKTLAIRQRLNDI